MNEEFRVTELGVSQMITDELLENGWGKNHRVEIERNNMRRAWAINVSSSFASRQLKHMEEEYYDMPKLLRFLLSPFRKKLVVDIQAFYPEIEIPGAGSHKIIYMANCEDEE